jgi:RNA polymerase sigma-70 factor (ECF subfamily)
MPEPEAERDLMERAQRGDRRAFDELVGVFYRAVYSYARRALGDEELALEVAQDTFARAFRYRASWKPGSGSVRSWLFAVAANRIRDARRERRDEPVAIEDPGLLAATGEEGLEAFARGALREEVVRAIEELSPEHREIVTLKYVSDLSYEEVAEVLGLSVSAAKMRALRARDLLARRLARLVLGSGSGEVDR